MRETKHYKSLGLGLLDRQVLGVIRLTLSRSVVHDILQKKTTTGLTAAFSSIYERPSANNKVYIMKNLFNLKMAEVLL